jgi:hemerythrin
MLAKLHELGHAAIDLDHRAVAECWGRTVDCRPIELPFFLARLRKVMSRHFDHEALLMSRAGGRLCEFHRREHGMLLALCDEARALTERDPRRARALLRNKLARLFREHIISMDQCAVLFIHSRDDRTQAG